VIIATRKTAEWTPEGESSTVEDCLFGPVVIDALDPFWLGADRGTNNTGELNGFAQALLFLKAQNDHDPAVICYDSKYAANTTDGTWDPKTNLDAVRICRDLYETEHARRDGGVTLCHVKGHSGDVYNDYADAFVQNGKGDPPYSRLRLARAETPEETQLRHIMLRAFGFPGFAAPIAEGVPPHTLVRTPLANPAVHRTPQPV
jgi:ribonuclease HI